MGTSCSTTRTRVEQLPAVLICRDRCKFLEEALHQSYALADAHLAYTRSLRNVGLALRRFFEIFPPAAAAAAAAAATNNSPTSPAADSTSHSGTDYSHEQFDDYFGTNTDDDRNNQEFYSMHGSCEVVTSTIPATPPAASSWDYYFNLFDVDQYSVAAMKEKQQEDETKSEDQENGAISCSNREKGESEEGSNWTKELEDLFQKASDSGVQVLEMLDTQKFRYHYHPTSGYWKMLEGSQDDDDDEWLISTHNLSSTLRKLCMWEHKLLGEVRVEEKLCMLLHIKKLKQKGGHDESSGSYSIRALSSKIKVAFHVIQNIFCTINNLTAEELWPHINQLIHRLSGMWQLMSEIHQKQHQIVKVFCDSTKEANSFGVDKLEILDDHHHHLQAAAAGLVLEQELQNWCLNFSKWIKAQRACINALNAWLHLNYDHDHDHKPDEADLHQASTTITCMPLVFLIIREWSNAMDRVSEEQVVATLNAFSTTIVGLQLADHQIMKHTAAHDGTDVFKTREGQKVQIKMKTALATQQVGQGGLTNKVEKHGASDNASPLSCLEQVFMAMDKLATDWKQAYQAILAGHALETYV